MVDLGTIRAQFRLEVRQAVAAYAAVRAANAATIYALRGGAEIARTTARGVGVVGLAFAATFGLAVKSAADFERKMDFFGAVTNATTGEMEAARKKALQLGQDTIFSANQIADSFVELGKSGVSTQTIIDGVGDAVAHLGAAADIPLDTAAQIIVAATQSFELGGKAAVHVADLLAGAANASIVDVQDLGTSLKYVGGVAHALGSPIESVIDALSLLGKYGIRGSTAGTSLRQILVSLAGKSKPAAAELKKLGIITKNGTNLFFDAKGSVKSLSDVFQILQDHTKGLTQEQKLSALRIIFNNRALAAAADLTQAGAKGFSEMNKEISKTTAADVSAKRLDNLSGDVEILRGNLQTLFIQGGAPFQNFLRGIVQGITSIVQVFGKLPSSVQVGIFAFIGVTATLLLTAAAILKFIEFAFRFYEAIVKINAVLRLLGPTIRFVAFAMKAFTLSLLTNPVFLIIVAIIAVVAALVLLYKHSARARAIIDAVGRALVTAFFAVVNFFKGLPSFFVGVWNAITSAFSTALDAVVGFVKKWGPLFLAILFGPLGLAIFFFLKFKTQIINFFKAIPGVLGNFAKATVDAVVSFFEKLPLRIAFIIGFMIGFVVRQWINFGIMLFNVARTIVTGVINFFTQLPGRIAAFFTAAARFAVNAWIIWATTIHALVLAIYHGIINFFVQLPGRIASFFNAAKNRAVSAFSAMRSAVVSLASRLVNGVIGFFRSLPGRAATFFNSVKTKISTIMTEIKTAVSTIASDIANGLINGINKIPEAIGGIVQKVIDLLLGVVDQVKHAAEKIGGALWNGFKKGAGIASPSYVEKAMFRMTANTEAETNKMIKHVSRLQQLGRTVNKIGDFVQPIKVDFATASISNIARSVGELQKAQAEFAATKQGLIAAQNQKTATITSVNSQQVAASVTLQKEQDPTRKKVILSVGGREFEAYLEEKTTETQNKTARRVTNGKKR